MPERGKFIVFEGIDGSGKTTQFNRLKKKLSKLSIPYIAEKEPTDGVIGRLARETVEKKLVLHPETLALIFAADRIEHIQTVILPALNSGVNVLCDRYVFSSLAYQSAALPMDKIKEANSFAINSLLPDLTLFIDVSPEICMERIRKNRNTPELFESISQARAIRENYLIAFESFCGKTNVSRIDGNIEIVEVFEKVWSAARAILGI